MIWVLKVHNDELNSEKHQYCGNDGLVVKMILKIENENSRLICKCNSFTNINTQKQVEYHRILNKNNI